MANFSSNISDTFSCLLQYIKIFDTLFFRFGKILQIFTFNMVKNKKFWPRTWKKNSLFIKMNDFALMVWVKTFHFWVPIATRGALGNNVFLLLLPRAHSQISKETFSLQDFSCYQALYNTYLKVVFKAFRAIKLCIRLALGLLSLA